MALVADLLRLARDRVVEDANASDAAWWRRLNDSLANSDREIVFHPASETFEIRAIEVVASPPSDTRPVTDADIAHLQATIERHNAREYTSIGEDVQRVRRYVLANGSGAQWPIARDAMSRVLDAYEHERARLQSLRDTFKRTSVIRSEDGIVIAPQRFDELHRLVEAAP